MSIGDLVTSSPSISDYVDSPRRCRMTLAIFVDLIQRNVSSVVFWVVVAIVAECSLEILATGAIDNDCHEVEKVKATARLS